MFCHFIPSCLYFPIRPAQLWLVSPIFSGHISEADRISWNRVIFEDRVRIVHGTRWRDGDGRLCAFAKRKPKLKLNICFYRWEGTISQTLTVTPLLGLPLMFHNPGNHRCVHTVLFHTKISSLTSFKVWKPVWACPVVSTPVNLPLFTVCSLHQIPLRKRHCFVLVFRIFHNRWNLLLFKAFWVFHIFI